MARRLRIWFYSICATVVSVAMWVVVIVLNLIKALMGETPTAIWAGWAITLASTAFFFVVFYKHFSETEQ